MFVFMDEVNKIPPGIWSDVDNLLANADGGPEVFKVGGAFNPQDESDQVGIRAEPEWGWAAFDMDQHFRWKSKRGWDVLRLDAMQCENIIEDRVVYPGLQTKQGMEGILKNAGGYDSPGYYSMVRAAYPPKGQNFAVIAQGLLHNAKAEVLWASAPRPCAGCDLALEGGDTAMFALGEWGMARGLKLPPSAQSPLGEEVLFLRKGAPAFQNILLLKNLYPLPRAETVEMAASVKALCQKVGVRPEWLCVDRTGNGSGVHDHLKRYWNVQVRGVNFYESASEKKIFAEDEKTPKEEYVRMVSELWFSMQKFLEFGYLKFDLKLDTTELNPELAGRLFAPGEKAKVESKKDYCSRGNQSPNSADAVGLMIHAVRMEHLGTISMNIEPGEVGAQDDDDYEEGWCFVDVTNMVDDL